MATRGTFAPELLPEGWFDETLKTEGWFSQDFLEPASVGGGTINATANQQIEPVTLSAGADVIISATASQAVGDVTQSANADVIVGASAGQTIGAVTQSATADLIITATASQTIANIALAAGATLSSGPINATAAQQIEPVTLNATASIGGAQTSKGDDAGVRRSKRPIVEYRPKIEKALEQVLELVEDIEPQNRTSVKRAAVKQAREAFRAIEIPANYEPASKAISEALAKVSRAAGEYESFQAAAMQAAMQIEALIAEMERKRMKRRREEEIVAQWLLS